MNQISPRAYWGVAVVTVLLSGFWLSSTCLLNVSSIASQAEASSAPTVGDHARLEESIWLKQVPFVRKRPDFGGEACVESALRFNGCQVDQNFVFDQSGVDPILGRGCVTSELVRAMRQCGFDPGAVWLPGNQPGRLQQAWNQIYRDLQAGLPSIVAIRGKQAERFVLVVGYRQKTDEVVYHDPGQDQGSHLTNDRKRFLETMPVPAQDTPQVVVLRCQWSPLKLTPARARFTNADYAQHVRRLRQRLPSDAFSIVIEKPFVVVGDGGEAKVRQTAQRTVNWAVKYIKQDYFKRDPHEILDIWLFKDPASYNKHNVELFGAKPTTPYGFYSSRNKALVMDISTGGGTLVHEIVHPFMESNFPDCPSWFNEGLASLYEQSAQKNGHIVGLTNWRLRGLQQAIRAKRLGSFKELCETTTDEFYRGAGNNYAQARYLCYYLQEQGRLVDYYHQFVKHARDDPGGYQTLQRILGEDDMADFQKRWEAYVLKLKF